MNWFPDALLAVRLLRGAGRREIVRLGATVLGVALAMFAVLLGLTTPLAISSGTDVEAARTPVIADRVVRDVPTLDRVTRSDVAVGGTPWTRVQVSGVTSGSPLPPGVEVWPAPGTTLVSPALAEVLTEHPVLQQALGPLAPGRVSRAGLTSPDELFSYTILGPGTPKSAAAATDEEPSRVVGFGGDPGSSGGSGGWFVLEVLLLVVAPSAVFTAMVLSLTAASRMRRGLALTLVGMTPTRAARLYASEMTIVGLAGAVIGVLVHAGVQGRLAESGVLGVTWWPEQGRTGLPVVVCAVVLATIGIRVLSRRSMRRVLARSPGQEQEGRRVRSSGWRAVLCSWVCPQPGTWWPSPPWGCCVPIRSCRPTQRCSGCWVVSRCSGQRSSWAARLGCRARPVGAPRAHTTRASSWAFVGPPTEPRWAVAWWRSLLSP